MAPKVVCQGCESDGPFATLESIQGAASISVYLDGFGVPHYEHSGSTEVFWDSSETVGYICRNCDFEAETFDKVVKVQKGEDE